MAVCRQDALEQVERTYGPSWWLPLPGAKELGRLTQFYFSYGDYSAAPAAALSKYRETKMTRKKNHFI